jgi:hypothetical protein
MDSLGKSSVLFVYYTYTQQTLKVAEAMADVLRGRGCSAGDNGPLDRDRTGELADLSRSGP